MHELSDLLPHGAARRDAVTTASSTSSVSRWLGAGDLVLAHPGVLVRSGVQDEWSVRARAASLWARAPLSHTSALVHWGLLPIAPGPVHVTVTADRFPRGAATVVAHRTTRPMTVVEHRDLAVLPVPRSLVDTWSWAHTPRRNPLAAAEVPLARQAVIEGVRDHGVTVASLRAESAAHRIHAGRVELGTLLDLVAGGCQSELEVWGVTRVLRIPSLPSPVQQHRVRLLDGRTVHLDAAWLEARVAVQLDGPRSARRAAKERDARSDSALAALGWVVLRFSLARLTQDPVGCRREVEAVVQRRLAKRWVQL